MVKQKRKVPRKRLSRVIITILVTTLLLPSTVFTPKTHAASSPRTGGAFYNYGEAM